ncbi:hypothetical protein [Sphingomonas sp.]|uniref:hypothetical protein n=1 Tax=Sphingomonas sp. TaxID=28214 RepID=UPI003B3A9679
MTFPARSRAGARRSNLFARFALATEAAEGRDRSHRWCWSITVAHMPFVSSMIRRPGYILQQLIDLRAGPLPDIVAEHEPCWRLTRGRKRDNPRGELLRVPRLVAVCPIH